MTSRPKGGWGLITTTGILTGFGHGFVAFAVSALLKPIALDLDTGRGAVSTAIGLGRLASGAVSPLVGQVVDRTGERTVVVAGMVLLAFGLVVLGFVQSEAALYFAWSVLVSVGVAAGFTVALDKLVVTANRERRGMALAVRFSVAAVVSTLLVPLVTVLVELVGWRNTCFIWAAIVLALLPIPLLTFGRTEAPRPAGDKVKPVVRPKLFASIAARPEFWLIAFAFMAQAAVVTGLSVHLLPLMTDSGLDAPLAGSIFGGMILLSIPVRLIAGRVADKAPAKVLPLFLAGLFLFEAVAIGSYAIWPGFSTMLVVIVAQGIGAGAPTLVVLLLCAHLFGENQFGAVQGLLMFFQVPGTAVAPILAGVFHDWYGDYRAPIAIFALLLLAGALAMALVRVPARAHSHIEVDA
ncbi:MFS transporter [Devosia sp. CAU 1758]